MAINDMIKYLLIGVGGLFALIVVAFFAIRKKLNTSEIKQMQQLRQGTKSTFNAEILYQKLYIQYLKIPLLRRYILKLRRRLEIINIDDEYLTRKQASKILSITLLLVVPLTIVVILLTHSNLLLMTIILIFELFFIDTIIDAMVDKIDNSLLKQQIVFFSEIRHAYHEFNMVEEAIYQVSQDDDNPEMSGQGEKIYEILISDDPESELEKYYDVSPNSYLKEFAGVSYLTKEFGDRKVDGASLYLKNVNNITQEMQLEILKRDKLDYVFQSLAVIAILPMLGLEPLKNWAVDQFAFTQAFYFGKAGLIVQILVLIVTFLSYILVRKLKDNGSVNIKVNNQENPWESKVYKIKIFKRITDMFIPKDGTKEHRKIKQALKDAASSKKIEWLFVDRLVLAVIVFIATLLLCVKSHEIAINYIYTQPTTDYDILGELSDKDKKSAMEVTEIHNFFLDKYKGDLDLTKEELEAYMVKTDYYRDATDADLDKNADKIMEKLGKINTEYLKWFEVLIAMVLGVVGYWTPYILLLFQVKMRQLEMENEIMQFQTIILMLMRIERVNVEIILEWLERYSNIFRGPISRCVNDYESGAWEALEAMKNEVTYEPFIRIIESLQAAVEKIPIRDAFDELETERDYYQAKRKESNDRLIAKKGLIGKIIGFAPMVTLFVGYLIIPLVMIGLTSMSSSFSTMKNM